MAFETSLEKLWESRDSAQATYDSFVEPFRRDKDPETMTAEQEKEARKLHKDIVKYEERILEVQQDEERAAKIASARKTVAPKIKVGSEPRVYGIGSDNSYVADLARASNPTFHGNKDACERLNRYSHEVEVHIAHNDKEGKRARKLFLEQRREVKDKDVIRRELNTLEERGRSEMSAEYRAPMSTTLGFGGELVTPVYLESEVVPYREAGRAFADAVNRRPLPDYGMTVYLPYVASPAGVAQQSAQNSGIQETDPTTGYLSSNLVTMAGQVTLSQQLLDRAGPNFAFDLLVFDQLKRDYNPKVDNYVLTSAIAGANAVTYTAANFLLYTAGAAPGATFAGVVAQAKSNIRTTAGVFLNPTHLFVQPDRAEYMTQVTDVNGRPLIVSRDQGPYNAAGVSTDGDYGVEGDARLRFLGLPVFTDFNIPANGSNEQALVLNAPNVWFWESTPVTRAVPQTLANDLSVLLQLYSYVGVIVPYPHAVQAISGTGLAPITW
jgi:hypothetical protein